MRIVTDICSAPDDIPNVGQIRTLLKNLRETRQVKARMGLDVLDDKWLGVSNTKKKVELDTYCSVLDE